MPNVILDLMVDRVDLVDEGANSEAFIKLYKRKETGIAMELQEILAKMKPEHAEVIQEAITKAKAEVPAETAAELEKAKEAAASFDELGNVAKAHKEEIASLQGQLEAIKTEEVAKSKEAAFDDVLKNADPMVQEVFKSIKAQKAAAEDALRLVNEQKVQDEAIAKAKDLKNLPVEEAKLVDVLKGVSPEVFEILKAANAAIEDGKLFEEVGKSKGTLASTTVQAATSEATAAWAKIEKKAQDIAVRDKVTFEAAVTKAMRENPELYQAYLDGGAN